LSPISSWRFPICRPTSPASLIKRGYPVYTFNQRSVAEILQMIRIVGALVGRADAGDALASRSRPGSTGSAPPRRDSRGVRGSIREWTSQLISGIRWVESLVENRRRRSIFRSCATGARQGSDHRSARVIERDPEVISPVVRQGDAEADDRRAPGLGSHRRRPRRSDLRDQVHLHPSAGPASLTDGVRQRTTSLLELQTTKL